MTSRRVLFLSCLAIGALVHGALFTPKYQLRHNASDSAPRGWYALIPARDIRAGDWVFAWLPARASRIAAMRGYLPSSVPVLKRVGAVEGHFACAREGWVAIDHRRLGRALSADGEGRTLEHWTGCRVLVEEEIFLFSPNSSSFDSRYFGPIHASAVLGQAVPLWTW